MRFIQLPTAIALVVVLQVRQDASQNPSAELGRVVGRVLDPSGAVLPGTDVTMTSRNGTARHVVSDGDGRFAFDGVTPDSAYAIRGTLAGFGPDEERDVVVTAGQTRVIALELMVCAVNPLVVTGITVSHSDLDTLLMADAIAHVRISDLSEDAQSGCGPTREARVFSVVPFSIAGQSLGATIRLYGVSRFVRGHEYLVLIRFPGAKHSRASVGFVREVVGGRIDGDGAVVDIHDGMRVEEALTRLRELRERRGR